MEIKDLRLTESSCPFEKIIDLIKQGLLCGVTVSFNKKESHNPKNLSEKWPSYEYVMKAERVSGEIFLKGFELFDHDDK